MTLFLTIQMIVCIPNSPNIGGLVKSSHFTLLLLLIIFHDNTITIIVDRSNTI